MACRTLLQLGRVLATDRESAVKYESNCSVLSYDVNYCLFSRSGLDVDARPTSNFGKPGTVRPHAPELRGRLPASGIQIHAEVMSDSRWGCILFSYA